MRVKKGWKKYPSHKYGPMRYHNDFRDGNYQECIRKGCGACRFEGDRYAYLRPPCIALSPKGDKKRRRKKEDFTSCINSEDEDICW